MEQQRYERVTGKLKEAIIAKLAASNPCRPISHDLHLHVQKRLHEFLPTLKIPSHPPYASMIYTAILELNEEGGSTEEAISSSIEKVHNDLPLAHSSFLSHYLRKLLGTGEVVCLGGGRYRMPVDVCGFGDKEEKIVHRFERKRYSVGSCRNEMREIQVRKKKKNSEVNKNLVSNEMREIVVFCGGNNVEGRQIEVVDGSCVCKRQKMEVSEREKVRKEEKENGQRIVSRKVQDTENLADEIEEERQARDGEFEIVEDAYEARTEQVEQVSVAQEHKKVGTGQLQMYEQPMKGTRFLKVKPLKEGFTTGKRDVNSLGLENKRDTGTMRSITPLSTGRQNVETDGSLLPLNKGRHGESQELTKRANGEQKQSQPEEVRNMRLALSCVGEAAENMTICPEGDKQKGFLEHESTRPKDIKGERMLIIVCGLSANSTKQQSQSETYGGQYASKSQMALMPASFNLSGEALPHVECPSSCEMAEGPRIRTLKRFTQNQQKPVKVYYRKKMLQSGIITWKSFTQNQQEPVKVCHGNSINKLRIQGEKNPHSVSTSIEMEEKQLLRWPVQRQRTKGITMPKSQLKLPETSHSLHLQYLKGSRN